MSNLFKSVFFGLFGLVLFMCSHLAQAQISPDTVSGSYTGLNHINRIINSTPGVTTTSVTGGVDAVASGPVNFNKGGINVPIPTSVTAKVTAGAIGLGAAKIGLRALPWVGAAITIKELKDAAVADGWRICPPPAFFCKDGPPLETKVIDLPNVWKTNSTNLVVTTTLTAHCQASLAPGSPNYSITGYRLRSTGATTSSCDLYFTTNGNTYAPDYQKYIYIGSGVVCPSGYNLVNSTCVKPGPDVNATQGDLVTSIGKKQTSNPALNKTLYDDIKATELANPSLGPVIAPSAVPIQMVAGVVAYPSTPVSTKTEPNADGNGTKTTTVAKQVTVTPTIGTSPTLAEPKITFPTTTTTTTTVVNNVTNVTNITTETTKEEPSNLDKPEPLPKDYNREATQLKILEQLDGSTLPDAPPDPTVKEDMKKVQDDLDKSFVDLPPAINDAKANWFSWVWSPTIGQCSESDYSGTVRGYAVNIGVCELVDKFREICGFLWAIIGALSIYSQIFKPRGEA